MKRLSVLLVFLFIFHAFCYPAVASSGDGLSFRINKFYLGITWTWQDEVPSMYDPELAIPLINLIHANYSKLAAIEREIYFDYWYDEDMKTFYLSERQRINDEWREQKTTGFTNSDDLLQKITQTIRREFDLSLNPDFISNVYVVFIPTEYIWPNSELRNKVEAFLGQSELYFAHSAALQSNKQGYVYSIFFNKNRMFSLLEDLDLEVIIINRKMLDLEGLQTLGVTEFKIKPAGEED